MKLTPPTIPLRKSKEEDAIYWLINQVMRLADSANLHTRVLKNIIERELIMDEKMAKVTKEMKMAEKDVKKGKPKAAVKELKKAEKKNVKLTKIDREERDPFIKKAKKMLKK